MHLLKVTRLMAEESKIAIIWNRFGPYHWARINAVAKCANILAIEMGQLDNKYAWELQQNSQNIAYELVFEQAVNTIAPKKIRKALIPCLDKHNPDVVAIPGYAFNYALVALSWCLKNNKAAIVLSDNNAFDRKRHKLKEYLKAKVVRLFGAGLVAGCDSRDYLVGLGLDDRRIYMGYDVVDNQFFAKQAQLAQANADKIRAKYGLPKQYFFCCARFEPKKNLLFLLEAFRQFQSYRSEISLVIAGDGSQRQPLETFIAIHQLENIYLLGFRQLNELAEIYGLAFAFVLPSLIEQWGLVVNEAMASGLPVIVSQACGCAKDLVSHTKNGMIFDPHNIDSLLQALDFIANDGNNAKIMGHYSQQRIKNWDLNRFSKALIDAATTAIQNKAKNSIWIQLYLYLLSLKANAPEVGGSG